VTRLISGGVWECCEDDVNHVAMRTRLYDDFSGVRECDGDVRVDGGNTLMMIMTSRPFTWTDLSDFQSSMRCDCKDSHPRVALSPCVD